MSSFRICRRGLLMCVLSCFSHVRLFATLWTVAHQAPLSMGFSRQEYWSGLPLLSPGDLPDPGVEPGSPALQAHSLASEPAGKPINPAWHPTNKCCTSLHHNPVSVNWLCCTADKQTQVWFGNILALENHHFSQSPT